jgi:hypothetical protein
MGTVAYLAQAIREGLKEAHPDLGKTLLRKLPLAVAAMLEAQTANTRAVANLLPLESERLDMREQWLRRLLSHERLKSETVLAPWARQALKEAGVNGQVIVLSLDQTDLGDRFAVLMISVRVGDRALPLAWRVEAGEANLGFAAQREVLDQVRGWLPAGVKVMVLADRFYPSQSLFEWLQTAGWRYRLRLKGNLSVDVGRGDIETTGDLAEGVKERYEPHARLFESGVPTPIGVLHEAGHAEPWIIAMDCLPTKARVLDYGLRWGIEPMFSDFKSRGFGLEETQLQVPERLDRLILIMALAMYWCVRCGREDAFQAPTPTEKKPGSRLIPTTGAFARPTARVYPGSHED